MRWTFAFLAAALAVVYFGMSALSDRQGNAGESEIQEARAAVAVPMPAAAAPTATPTPASLTEYVSGCIETATTCRCIDKQGKPLELTREDCKGVLAVGPK